LNNAVIDIIDARL